MQEKQDKRMKIYDRYKPDSVMQEREMKERKKERKKKKKREEEGEHRGR